MDPIDLKSSMVSQTSRTHQKVADHNPEPESCPSDRIKDDQHRLDKACADFEALFVQQLFKAMRATVPESPFLGRGPAEDLYTSLLDQQVAQEMAQGGGRLGLADQIRNKLTHYLALRGGLDTK